MRQHLSSLFRPRAGINPDRSKGLQTQGSRGPLSLLARQGSVHLTI
jgi:hypothetical protein